MGSAFQRHVFIFIYLVFVNLGGFAFTVNLKMYFLIMGTSDWHFPKFQDSLRSFFRIIMRSKKNEEQPNTKLKFQQKKNLRKTAKYENIDKAK